MHSLEAEVYVIGCCILYPELAAESYLEPEHFFYDEHQLIFEGIKDVLKSGGTVGTMSVIEAMKRRGTLDASTGPSYIVKMTRAVVGDHEFSYTQRVIIDNWKIRETRKILETYDQVAMVADGPNFIAELMQRLEEVSEVGHITNESTHIRDIMFDVLDDVERDAKDKRDITGAATGFVDLDRMTAGLQKSDLIIVAARPSVGKTAFALNVSEGTTRSKHVSCDVYSYEMGGKQLGKRMGSSTGNIDATVLRSPGKFMKDDDWYKLVDASAELSERNIHVYAQSGMTTAFIRANSRANQRKYKKNDPDNHHIILIDYLQLIPSHTRSGNRQEEVSQISRELKQIARDLDCTVIALSQLSRGVEQRQDKRPMMSDLRESGSIEQDADIVAFLYRDDYYNQETEKKNIIEIIIAKQRNGPTGTVELVFLKQYNKFVNYNRGYDNARKETGQAGSGQQQELSFD